MSNYFQKVNQFKLIDVDGVFLDNPLDELIINEPENTRQTDVSIERSVFDGVDLEFSNAEIPFVFDKVKYPGQLHSGYALIKAIKQAKGGDGKCIFQMLSKGIGDVVFSIDYSGELDFYEYSEIDYAITISSRRINIDDKFRTRRETKVNVSSSQTIDGEAISPLSSESMFLHSRLIRSNQKSSSSNSQLLPLPSLGDGYLLAIAFRSNIKPLSFIGVPGYVNEIESQYGGGVFTQFYNVDPLNIEGNYTFTKTGRLSIDLTCHFLQNLASFSGVGTYNYSFNAYINGQIVAVLDSGSFSAASDPEIDFSYSGYIDVEPGDVLLFGMVWDYPDVTGNYTIQFQSDHLIELEFDAYELPSFAKVYPLYEVVERVIHSITGQPSILISPFLQSTLSKCFISNGYLIRGFSVSERPLLVSFKELFDEFLLPVFGLGYAVVLDEGTYKIKIGRYSDFYTDNEIDYIDSIVDKSWSIVVDKKIHFNEIEVGYSDYPKNTDENKANNIDEFNTIHINSTPIERYKNKASFVSSIIASGYKISSQREEQFAEVPKETVSDDDKVFVIMGIESDVYQVSEDLTTNDIASDTGDFLFLNGTYFDVRVGDEIYIETETASVYDEETYTVESVEYVGKKMRLKVSETLINAGYDGAWTLTLPEVRLRALRNDELDVITGVVDPNTVFNVGLNPKYMLFNHSLKINSGFNLKTGVSLVKPQEVKLNSEMSCQFSIGEGGYVLDPDRLEVEMGGDLPISDINQNQKLFTGNILKFKSNDINIDRITNIRDAHLDNSHGDFYGFVRVKGGDGNDYKGFLKSNKYKLIDQEAEFELFEMYE